MSRTPSTSTQEIQMDMFDHHGSHAQVRETLLSLVRATNERQLIQPAARYLRMEKSHILFILFKI